MVAGDNDGVVVDNAGDASHGVSVAPDRKTGDSESEVDTGSLASCQLRHVGDHCPAGSMAVDSPAYSPCQDDSIQPPERVPSTRCPSRVGPLVSLSLTHVSESSGRAVKRRHHLLV